MNSDQRNSEMAIGEQWGVGEAAIVGPPLAATHDRGFPAHLLFAVQCS